MKTFLSFDLRFLIGGWPVIRVGWQRAREAAPSQRAPEDWRTPRRWREQLMFPCKHLIFRRLGPFYGVFRPISQPQGFDFSPVTKKTGFI